MNTVQTLQIVSVSSEETESIGARCGAALRGGEVIELVSDLGGGKTTFVRGLAAGFGSGDRVASPTFTLSKVYTRGNKQIHHFDFYRLDNAGVVGYELDEVVGDPDCVVVVEWGDIVRDVLPPERCTISIRRTGEASRELSVSCPQSLAYLAEAMRGSST